MSFTNNENACDVFVVFPSYRVAENHSSSVCNLRASNVGMFVLKTSAFICKGVLLNNTPFFSVCFCKCKDVVRASCTVAR